MDEDNRVVGGWAVDVDGDIVSIVFDVDIVDDMDLVLGCVDNDELDVVEGGDVDVILDILAVVC